ACRDWSPLMADVPPFLLHQWLGIAPQEKSPSSYRILGLADLEPEPDVIAFVSGWRIRFIEEQMRGALSDVAKRLREQMRMAQAQLLDPQQKQNYDAQLRSAQPALAVPGPLLKGDDARRWLGVVTSGSQPTADNLLVGIRQDETDVGVLKSQYEQRLA